MNEETESIQVYYRVMGYRGRIPGRYILNLTADDIDSGISVVVWGRRRAAKLADSLIESASELLQDLNLAQTLGEKIIAKRAASEAAEGVRLVQVDDKVRLLVDIGPYKRGRVFKVVEVAQTSGYEARGGANEWDDLHYPIKVVPVSSMPGEPTLGAKDGIPLAADEFCPGDREVD